MNPNPEISLYEKLLDKSKEAFVMALEVYNKPSIRYRIEGFSFFICNAWELMLKAYIIKTHGESEIYYKDNPDRTITLENCVKAVFTNEHAPIRKNLQRIIELRNTSTHFIVEEYEMVYVPLFQACIFNYSEKMYEFHHVDVTRLVPQNFLTLTVSMRALNALELRAKYPGQISERLLSAAQIIGEEANENSDGYAIRIIHEHYITKDRNKATDIVHFEKNASAGVTVLKELKDVNDIYKFSAKKLIREVNNRLRRSGVVLYHNGSTVEFNRYHFDLFVKYYHLKDDSRLCYTYRVNQSPTYSYSIQAIDFIAEEIKKDPESIIQNLKDALKKQ